MKGTWELATVVTTLAAFRVCAARGNPRLGLWYSVTVLGHHCLSWWLGSLGTSLPESFSPLKCTVTWSNQQSMSCSPSVSSVRHVRWISMAWVFSPRFWWEAWAGHCVEIRKARWKKLGLCWRLCHLNHCIVTMYIYCEVFFFQIKIVI